MVNGVEAEIFRRKVVIARQRSGTTRRSRVVVCRILTRRREMLEVENYQPLYNVFVCMFFISHLIYILLYLTVINEIFRLYV